jgi:hypothetical protein
VLKLESDEAENIAREFLLNRLRASSVEVLDAKLGPEPDVMTVSGFLEDGDRRRRKFEVKVSSLTKKAVTWNVLFGK